MNNSHRTLCIGKYESLENAAVDIMFETSTRGYFGLDRYLIGEFTQEVKDMLTLGRTCCSILENGRSISASGGNGDDIHERASLLAYNYMMDSMGLLGREGYDKERIFSEAHEVREAIEEILAGHAVDLENFERYKQFFNVVGLPFHYIKKLPSDDKLAQA